MPGPHDIAAAVLSAGESRRMGSPKALLDAGDGETFVERIVTVLRTAGLRRILVVVAPDSGPIRLAVERVNASVLVNPDPSAGPISSIRTARGEKVTRPQPSPSSSSGEQVEAQKTAQRPRHGLAPQYAAWAFDDRAGGVRQGFARRPAGRLTSGTA